MADFQAQQGDEEAGPRASSVSADWDPRILEPLQNGYREIAHLMAFKDSPFAIFRRFGQLSMLNLLSLQAELMELQAELRYLCKTDDSSNDPLRTKFAYSFLEMRENYEAIRAARLVDHQSHGHTSTPKDPAPQQYELILKIRDKLKEYSECLLFTCVVCQLD
jgi:hypothetical protein